MQFSVINTCLLAVAGISTAVLAQTAGFDVVSQPQSGDALTAGKPYTIKWTPGGASGTVSIVLLQGKTNTTLQLGNTIGHSIQSSAGQYVWDSVPSSPEYPLYGLKIELDSDPTTFQYSSYFTIDGDDTPAHDSVATSSGSASSASVSAPASVSYIAIPTANASPSTSGTGSSLTSVSVYAKTTVSNPVATGGYPVATLSTSYRNSSNATSSATHSSSANTTGSLLPAHTGAAGNIIASGATLLAVLLFSVALLI